VFHRAGAQDEPTARRLHAEKQTKQQNIRLLAESLLAESWEKT
jgi:hypothetical protein